LAQLLSASPARRRGTSPNEAAFTPGSAEPRGRSLSRPAARTADGPPAQAQWPVGEDLAILRGGV